jgi:integrase
MRLVLTTVHSQGKVMNPQQKGFKGSVGIETFQGRLRLRLPRQLYGGQQKYLTLSLDDSPENQQLAKTKVKQIEADIADDLFDPTLVKYRSQTHIRLVQPEEETQKALTLLELWDKYTQYRKPQIAPTTFLHSYQKRYLNAIQQLPTQDLSNAIDICDYLLKTKTPSTAKQLLIQFSACCEWGVKVSLVTDNPFKGMAEKIRIVKDETEIIDPFSHAERDAIISAFLDHPRHCYYAPYIKFLFMTGCRTSEAIGLQWKHINHNCTQIIFSEAISKGIRKDTKTHKSRKFPCNAKLQYLLLGIRPKNYNSDELVFPNRKNQPINAATFLHNVWSGEESKGKVGIVTQLVKEGKIERYRPQYNTRHTFVSMALEAGVSVVQVAKWVGNSPEIIMKHYAGTIKHVQVPEF